jgi:hypothetical protein
MWIFSATYIYSSCGTLNRATIIISFCGGFLQQYTTFILRQTLAAIYTPFYYEVGLSPPLQILLETRYTFYIASVA